MSGEKRTYVSVEETELRRLREQESRLRTLDRDLPERLEAVRQQAEREMRNRMAPIEARQRQHENMVKGLKSELGGLEKETQQRLQHQHNEFVGQLKKQQKETHQRLERERTEVMGRLTKQRNEYLNLFEVQDRKFTSEIEEERRHRKRALDDLQGQINSITDDAVRKENISRSFILDLTKIMHETDKLPHERFAPGRLNAIQRYVDDAERNLNSGHADAALSTAQSAYWDVADLRVEVFQKEQEFMLIYQAALQEARSLLEEARSNRKYQLEVGEGGERNAFELEVDHWTNGELSALEQELKSIEDQLIQGEPILTTEHVKETLSRIEALKPRTPEIVEHAKQNILASQLRFNIGELAAEALRGQGFAVEDAVYAGEDERNAYIVKVKNVAGSEVVTIISPVENAFGKNTISINSYDETYIDDVTLQQRAREVVGLLQKEGLQVGTPECAGGAKPEYRDIAAIRRQQTIEMPMNT